MKLPFPSSFPVSKEQAKATSNVEILLLWFHHLLVKGIMFALTMAFVWTVSAVIYFVIGFIFPGVTLPLLPWERLAAR